MKNILSLVLLTCLIILSGTIVFCLYPNKVNAANFTPPKILINGTTEQGSIVFGKVENTTSLLIDGKAVRFDPNGNFVFGIGRDADKNITITAKNAGHIKTSRVIKVKPKKWLVQKIDNLASNMVNPSPSELARIKTESTAIKKAKNTFTGGKVPFCFSPPFNGKITSRFGSQRILNGEKKTPHGGIDIKGVTGTPVNSVADGKVVLINEDSFYNGKLVIIDHGFGMHSTYAHLSKIDVKEGEKVKRNQKIGEVGNTGRSTGPHLHLGINWYDTNVDPLYVFLISSQKCESIKTYRKSTYPRNK